MPGNYFRIVDDIRIRIPIQWRKQLVRIAEKLAEEKGYKVSVPDLIRDAIYDEFNLDGKY